MSIIKAQEKLLKRLSETITYTLNLTDLLNSSETISIINSVSTTLSGLSIISSQINGEIILDSVTIAAGKSVNVVLSSGIDEHEYKITFTLLTSLNNILVVSTILLVSDSDEIYYGAVNYGEDYFKKSMKYSIWNESNMQDKIRALTDATRRIDRLNYSGAKYSETQKLQFPRGTDTLIPTDIENATYEIAIKLLDEIDPEIEANNLSVISQGISSVKKMHDRSSIADYIRVGIPSLIAWGFLKPYLIDPHEINCSRVS